MDPNETLRLLAFAILAEDKDAAREHYENLRDWLARGGVEPAWMHMNRRQFRGFNPRTGRIE